jgi:hypothetical protein
MTSPSRPATGLKRRFRWPVLADIAGLARRRLAMDHDAASRHGGGAAGKPDRPMLAGLVVVAVLAITVRLLLLLGAEPALFWDSPSYIDYARQWVADGRLPPIGIRTPGYPLFLILLGDGARALKSVIVAQQVLGVLSACLLYLLVALLTRRVVFSLLVALLGLTLVDLLFMEVTIYAETLALLLVNLAAVLLVVGFQRAPTRAVPLFGSAAVWTAAALVRPVFALAAGVVVAGLWLAVTRRRLSWRLALLVSLVPCLVLGGYAIYNSSTSGFVRLALGRGFSMLNYVGYPAIYQSLPPHLAHIRRAYQEEAVRTGEAYLGWGRMLQPVLKAQQEHGGYHQDWDEAAARVALDAIRNNPRGYARIWGEVLRQYLSDYFVWYGLFTGPDIPQEQPAARIGGGLYAAVRLAEGFWKGVTAPLSAAALLLPPVVVLDSRRRWEERCVIGMLWLIVVILALATTAVEPSSGQARYRMPLAMLHLGLAAAALGVLVGDGREIARRIGRLGDAATRRLRAWWPRRPGGAATGSAWRASGAASEALAPQPAPDGHAIGTAASVGIAERTVEMMYAAITVGLGIIVLSAPLEILLDRFMPDDAFYYFNPARIFARTGFSSFDGLHFTNGYQPLWFLLSVPVFVLFPGGGELPIRLLLFLQLALSVVTMVMMVRVLGRLFGALAAAISCAIFVVVFQRIMLNGLETALQMLLFILLFAMFDELRGERTPSARWWLSLGTVAGLAFLARTDLLFLVGAIFLFLLPRTRAREGRTAVALYSLPLATLAGGYLLINLLTTGHLMPVSGAAKQFHSALARQAAIAEAGNSLTVYLANLTWPLTEANYRFLLIGLAGPWLLMAITFPWRRATVGSVIWHFWPFTAAGTAAFLFYGTSFYGGFTRTLWYYGPQTFSCCMVLAWVGWVSGRRLAHPGAAGLVMLLLVGTVLGWVTPQTATLLAGVGLVGWAIVGRAALWPPVGRGGAALALVVACVAIVYLQGLSLSGLLMLSVVLILLAVLVVDRWWPDLALPSVAAAGMGVFVVVHGLNLARDAITPASYWNYHLYRGALWARESLPPGTTIWSGSAGILGYFSDHPVINTDGLANSYEFLESVLMQGKLLDYYRQWDYGIDAFPDPNDLPRLFPEGCFVALPSELTRLGFEDGPRRRRLQIFAMNGSGEGACKSATGG